MTDTNLKSLSKAELVALAQEYAAKEAATKALEGVKVEFASGITKSSGKAWQNVSVSGGLFGWPGIKLTPAKWDRLLEIQEHVSTEIDSVRDLF